MKAEESTERERQIDSEGGREHTERQTETGRQTVKAGESTERQTKRERQTDSEGGREHRERQTERGRQTDSEGRRERKKERGIQKRVGRNILKTIKNAC